MLCSHLLENLLQFYHLVGWWSPFWPPPTQKKRRFFFIFCCKLIDQKQTMENPIAHIEPNVLFIEQLDPKNNTKLNSLSTPKKFLSFAQFQALNFKRTIVYSPSMIKQPCAYESCKPAIKIHIICAPCWTI